MIAAPIQSSPTSVAVRGTPTTTIDRLLVMAVVILLPAENIIRFFDILSLGWLLFGLMAFHILLTRPRLLIETALHPVFLAGWLFIVVAITIETGHPLRDYSDIIRTLQMLIGGMLLACLCRDRAAVQAAVYAYVIAGVWLCLMLFLTSYRILEAGSATTFQQASQVRSRAFGENPLQANLNAMAFVAAQGAIVSLTLALAAPQMLMRVLFLSTAAFCMVGSWLPSSRSGILIAVITCGAMMLANRKRGARVVVVAAVLVIGVAIWVPEAVYARLVIGPTHYTSGKEEGRTKVYSSALTTLPEYLGAGVGVGNFWTRWGESHGFARNDSTLGAHNTFIQITIYWGIVGLSAWLFILYQAYRCVPRVGPNDPLGFCLYGVALSLVLLMLFRHTIYAKEFSLGLGLLVGARRWVFTAPLSKRTRALLSALRLRSAQEHGGHPPPHGAPGVATARTIGQGY
jgi:hypothetical protein